jgi:hypothetical protein
LFHLASESSDLASGIPGAGLGDFADSAHLAVHRLEPFRGRRR